MDCLGVQGQKRGISATVCITGDTPRAPSVASVRQQRGSRGAAFAPFRRPLRLSHADPSGSPAIATTVNAPAVWTPRDSEKLYNMSGWGLGYFRVNAEGHVTVHPDGKPQRGLDLYRLAMDLNAQGVGLPVLLRFSDILRSRI